MVNIYFQCTNSEMNECRNPIKNRIGIRRGDNDEYYSSKDINIVSLILQSVEHQVQAEETRRCQYVAGNSSQEIEMPSELPPTSTTTAVVDLPITTAALITATPITAMMIMNRHRRSRYEQESLQAVPTIPNTSSTTVTTTTVHYLIFNNEYKIYVCHVTTEFTYI